MSVLTAERDELKANLVVRDAARAAAENRARRSNGAIGRPTVAGIRDYMHSVATRKRAADPKVERALVVALCRDILENEDLTFINAGEEPRGGARLRLDDLEPARLSAEARLERDRAAQELHHFEHVHAKELSDEEDQARRDALNDALKSGSVDRIREALGIGKPRALRTEDFRVATAG